MALKLRSLSLNLPFGLGGVEVEVSEQEARAAWSLYVEFATRVTGSELAAGAGFANEALASVYGLFGATRGVLREAGPEIARKPTSLGPLTIEVLNRGLRPFLVRWHGLLRASGDEPEGELRAEFDQELADLRKGLGQYVEALAEIAGVKE